MFLGLLKVSENLFLPLAVDCGLVISVLKTPFLKGFFWELTNATEILFGFVKLSSVTKTFENERKY